MENKCSEALVSEDYADILVRYRLGQVEFSGQEVPCASMINNTWAVLNYPLSDIPKSSYRAFGYYRIPKLYTVTDMTSMEESGVTETLAYPALNNTGRNILVGIIDTGIDFAHPVFRTRQGRTRIKAIWDQNGMHRENDADVPFGRVYKEEEINQALESERPYEQIPGDLPSGHGTFIAGIAAGSYIEGEFTGAAPEASIAVVKLKPAKKYLRDFYLISPDALAYSETDIMFGVNYLSRLAAQLSMPLVILLGIGTTYGPHTGQTPLGRYLADVAVQGGCVVTAPTGNEGNGRRHFYGQISGAQPQTVEVNVGRDERGFIMELWGNPPDVFTVEFISPSGEQVSRIPAYQDESREIRFIFERTRIQVDYKLIETISGRHLTSMRFENPTEGIWRINVYGSQIVWGVYNIWLPMGDFLSSDTYFLSSNPDITLTEPGAGAELLTVSAYNHYNDSIYIESGRGFAADGAVKPDIAAPGVNVYGPVPGDRFGRRSGTSIAAAHAAGCAALLLDWGINNGNMPYMNTANVKNLLIKGAVRESSLMYPNKSWGYGKLNIFRVFESLRRQ